MTLAPAHRVGILLILALVMAATRINHFAPLPDASWAVFLAAGFYLRGQWRWAFPLLLAEAVLIDYLVISAQGLAFWNHYCMSPAYLILLAAYPLLWVAGAFLRGQYRGLDLRSLALLVGTAFVAVNLFYLVSNGSFYWLADSVPLPRSFGAWMQNLGDWYPAYLRINLTYVAAFAAVHVLVVLAAQRLARTSIEPLHR